MPDFKKYHGIILRPGPNGGGIPKFYRDMGRGFGGYHEGLMCTDHPTNHRVDIDVSVEPDTYYSFYFQIPKNKTLEYWSVWLSQGDRGSRRSPFTDDVTEKLRTGAVTPADRGRQVLGVPSNTATHKLVRVGGNFSSSLVAKIEPETAHYKMTVIWIDPETEKVHVWDPEMEVNAISHPQPVGGGKTT